MIGCLTGSAGMLERMLKPPSRAPEKEDAKIGVGRRIGYPGISTFHKDDSRP